MIALKMENSSLASTRTEAGTDADTHLSSTASTALHAVQHTGPRLLIVLASWLVRIEHRMRRREPLAGWDTALSLQLDRLTDIQERLAEYRDAEQRQP
jgi:hypothetical protein